jgi:hypothetical protein
MSCVSSPHTPPPPCGRLAEGVGSRFVVPMHCPAIPVLAAITYGNLAL